MKPKLVLIHPQPDKDRLSTRRRTKSSIAQLNLPLLAAYASDLFEVKIVDENIEDIDFNLHADLIGITIMTPTAMRGYAIADNFRGKNITVVLGGMHVFSMPEEALEYADSILVGEAEHAWNEMLGDFISGQMKKRYESSKVYDLKNMLHPRIDLLNPKAYSFINVIETARGCPHNCTYCAVSQFWGQKFRFRPTEEVIEEIKAKPPGDIMFVDDNMFGKPSRAKELFRAMIPLKRRWSGQGDLRLSRDPELLNLAARSGCKWIFMGIESTDSETLAEVKKKNLNRAHEYETSIATIHKRGIKVFGSFIFGLDNDDTSAFQRTLDFCVKNKIGGANFYILTPLPGTPLFNKIKSEGRLYHKNWARYDMNHVVFRPAKMTPEELHEGYIKTYRSFYSWSSILRRSVGHKYDMPHVFALNYGRRLGCRYFEEGCRI